MSDNLHPHWRTAGVWGWPSFGIIRLKIFVSSSKYYVFWFLTLPFGVMFAVHFGGKSSEEEALK